MERYHSRVLGTGSYYPKKVVTNDDLSATLDTSHEWIFERTGICERRISSPEGGEYPVDMAYHATMTACEQAGCSPTDIDLIIFATFTPDNILPNSASQLQKRLGITNQCACLDLAAACSGFVYGLSIADSFIQLGKHKKVLVVGAEMISSALDWSDRNVAILFGDGAGVALLGRAVEGECSQILSVELGANGEGRDFLYQEYGGSAKPYTKEIIGTSDQFFKMKGREMFKVAVRNLAEISQKALDAAGVSLEDIKWVVPHQANIRILETLAKRLDIPLEKMIITIDKYANTSAASVPMALHDGVCDGRIQRGDLVLMSVFGAGLTFGAAVIRY